MSWLEIARRLAIYRNVAWRWKEFLARPNKWRGRDLLELADSMALSHLFTE